MVCFIIWFMVLITPIVTGTYISFTEEPADDVVTPKSDVSLMCKASSQCGPLSYAWVVNDTSVTLRILKSGGAVLVKLRKPVQIKCTAKCDYGAIASRTALVQIAYVSIKPLAIENVVIFDGEPILLATPVLASLPRLQFKWYKKENSVLKNVSTNYLQTTNGSLFIPSVKQRSKDNGIYELYGFNPIISAPNALTFIKTFNITLKGPFLGLTRLCPNNTIVFLSKLQNIVVKAGSNVVVDCLAAVSRCWGGVRTGWSFGSQRLSSSRRLTIDTITKAFEGEHVCTSSYFRDIQRRSIKITVAEKPKFKVMPHSKIVLQQAGDIFISSGSVDTASSVTWYFNGVEVRYGKKYILLGDNTLKVNDGTYLDAGLYQVVYTSLGGSTSAVIQVESKTGCDTIMKASSGTISFYQSTVPVSEESFECMWTVQLGGVQATRITFEKFAFRTLDCASSKVEILANSGGFSMSVAKKFCALQPPGSTVIEISGSVFIVRVTSKRSFIESGGFVLRFEKYIPIPQPSITVTPPSSSSLQSSKQTFAVIPTASLSSITVNSASVGFPIDRESESSGDPGIIVGVILGVLLPMLAALLITLLLCKRKRKKDDITEMLDIHANGRPASCAIVPTSNHTSASNLYTEGACPSVGIENDYTAPVSNYMPLVYPHDDKKTLQPNNYSYATEHRPCSSYDDNPDDIYYSVAVSPAGSYSTPNSALSDSSSSPANNNLVRNASGPSRSSSPGQPAYMSPMYAAVDNIDLTVENPSVGHTNSPTRTSGVGSVVSEPIYNDVDTCQIIDEELPYQSLQDLTPRLNSESSGTYQRLDEVEPTYGIVDSPGHYTGLEEEKFSEDVYHELDLQN